MTAVVGILNRRGVAIAADSAVTRNRINEEKVTKNGNKMLRISNTVPISVMITGNGCFLGNPWDVVIRCYRRERGHISHPTVEACLHDLFDYISSNEQLWSSTAIEHMITNVLDDIFWETEKSVGVNVDRHLKSRSYTLSRTFIHTFLKLLKKQCRAELAKGVCPQFDGYTIESFRAVIQPIFKVWIAGKTNGNKTRPPYPKEFLSEIKGSLEQMLFAKLTTRTEIVYNVDQIYSSTLVFTGYGTEQEYPSLVAVRVCGGFDNRVNYHIRKEDIVCISNEKPIAICPFAQTDISTAIISGLHKNSSINISTRLKRSLTHWDSVLFGDEDELDSEFTALLSEIKIDDLQRKVCNAITRQQKKNQQVWENQLKNCDVKTMAALAESMIDLTGFHRILTFQQEGVGGPVDVAVITKNDGFTWLSRKSWYHHKDVNGQYGKLGI